MKDAERKFKQFHGRQPEKIGRVAIPAFKRLVLLGEGLAIEYRAAKRNDPRTSGRMGQYRHVFKKGVRIFTDPKGKALVVVGGKFRVTDWMRD